METPRKYIILYVSLIVVVFIITHMTTLLTARQATELMVSSILFVFLFGIVSAKLTGRSTAAKAAVFGFYYTLWYFVTKATTNAVLRDSKGNIQTTT